METCVYSAGRQTTHAVLLDIPADGSVPDVLPWQSLRKCSFAAPFFHDPELPLPDVDEHALPMMPDSRSESVPRSPPINGPSGSSTLPIDATPDEWHSWSETALYDIESIVGAEPSGRGWKVQVKWLGHPTVTTERLSSITSRVTDPRILGEIENRKAEYLAKYPSAPPSTVVNNPTRRRHPRLLRRGSSLIARVVLLRYSYSSLRVMITR